MNANELANALDKAAEYLRMIGDADFKQAATMLRQQQAEIEALKVETTMEVMSEHCTCYKLGYNPLNDYRKVKAK
jgi:DNA-binding ferritin-like protein